MSESDQDNAAAMEATVVEYLTAFNRGDVPRVIATYAEEGVLMAPGMPAAEGKGQLSETYHDVFDAVDFDMAYQIKEVVQTSVEWGFVRSTTEGTETIKASRETVSAQYQELFLLQKTEAGAWQIARYCTTKVSP